jgi:hypothetical protein
LTNSHNGQPEQTGSQQPPAKTHLGTKHCARCGGTGWAERDRDGPGGYTEVVPCQCRTDLKAAVERQRGYAAQGRINYRREVEPPPEDAEAKRDFSAVWSAKGRAVLADAVARFNDERTRRINPPPPEPRRDSCR